MVKCSCISSDQWQGPSKYAPTIRCRLAEIKSKGLRLKIDSWVRSESKLSYAVKTVFSRLLVQDKFHTFTIWLKPQITTSVLSARSSVKAFVKKRIICAALDGKKRTIMCRTVGKPAEKANTTVCTVVKLKICFKGKGGDADKPVSNLSWSTLNEL